MSAHPHARPTLVSNAEPRRSRRWIYGALGVLLALGAVGWGLSHDRQEPEVQVVTPVRGKVESTVSASGVVVPVRDYAVRANFSGMIDKIYVQPGQQVRAGQMLLQMKDQYAVSRLDTARAALKASQASLEDTEKNGTSDERIGYAADLARAQSDRDEAAAALASLQSLAQRGSASQAEVLNATRQLKLADITLQTLRNRMAHRYSPADLETQKAKVREAMDQLAAERVSWANANISSPISGTVYILPVLPYDFVSGGAELMHVADLSQFQVRANFNEPDLAKLQAGRPATIRWEGEPGKTWSGKVFASPMAVDRSGPLPVGHCIISLTSPIGDLPINSTVSVTVQAEQHSNVLTIPHQALHESGPDKFVYSVYKGRLRKTPVTLGLVNEMTVEITSGLTDRDDVAVRSMDGAELSEGRRVKIVHKT